MENNSSNRSFRDIKIFQWNIRSINANRGNLVNFIIQHEPDVILLNETWLKEEYSFKLKGYNIIRQDREDGHGGIASCIKNNIKFSIVKNVNKQNVQSLTIKIDNINITNVYAPPKNKIQKKEISSLFDGTQGLNVLMGDINAVNTLWRGRNTNCAGRALEEFLEESAFILLSEGNPTRLQYPSSTTNALDITMVNSDLARFSTWAVIEDCGFSDHFPTICVIERRKGKNMYFRTYEKRNIKKAEWPRYQYKIEAEIEKNQPNSLESLVNHIHSAANEAIPMKMMNRHVKCYNPWWDHECKLITMKRKNQIRVLMENPNLDNFIKAKLEIARTRRIFRKKKKDKFVRFCSSLNRHTNITEVWNKAKQFSGINPKNLIHQISDEERMNLLISIASNDIKYNFQMNKILIHSKPFNMVELDYCLQDKKNSAPGLDDIYYSMISNLPLRGKKILIEEFNKILMGDDLPKALKEYNIMCIPKHRKEENGEVKFRPIVLAPTILKTLELLIKGRLEWVAENQNMFKWYQVGFRKKQGVHNAQGLLIADVQYAFSKEEHVLAVFLDIKSAYDNVNIYRLYEKLNKMKFPVDIVNVVFKILSNRLLFSKNQDGLQMGPILTNAGLPQGSPLSPLLFNLYIKDIYNILQDDCRLITYADDLVIFTKGKNMEQMKDIMNKNLRKLDRWMEQNNFQLAYNKCEAVWFNKNNKKRSYPTINLKEAIIRNSNQVKFLGLVLQKNLIWDTQVEETKRKTQKGINIMKAISRVWWGSDPQTLLTIFYGLVRSHLDFGGIFIKPTSLKTKRKLNVIFHQGIRVALGCMRSTPINALLGEAAEWDLNHRKRWLASKFLAKIICYTDHPLVLLIKEISWEFKKKSGYWKGKDIPFLIQAYEDMKKYEGEIRKADNHILYEVEKEYQIREIKKIVRNDMRKGDRSSHQKALEVFEKFRKTHVITYTDASKRNDRVAIGIHIPQFNINFTQRIPDCCNICSAEIVAINEAVTILLKKEIKKAIIVTDSHSAILKINSQRDEHDHISLLTKRLILEANDNGRDFVLVWIPGHIGVKGNETADILAKSGTNFNIPKDLKVDAKEVLTLCKKKNKKRLGGILEKGGCDQGQMVCANSRTIPQIQMVQGPRIHQPKTYYLNNKNAHWSLSNQASPAQDKGCK